MPRKGQTHTEEAKRKMREAWKTRPPLSKETRRKQAESLKGKMAGEKHWNYGNKTPEEVSNKISESLTGSKNPMYGKQHSEDTRRLMREAAKGRGKGKNNSMYGKTGKDSPLYGRKHKESTIKLMSERAKNRSEETLRKMSIAQQNRPPISEETRRRQSEAHKGVFPNQETRRKMSEARMGDKNPNWRGGMSYGHGYNPMWVAISRSIVERDGKCMFPYCGTIDKLCSHHIDYNRKNDNPMNLIVLCRAHNGRVNFHRDHWKKYFTRLNKVRLEPRE